jgi:class 3 adenylate cyclase/tetratricopeptide (TPR) repeat protein
MASPEQRKTVTIVFCDLTGSTAMGEQLDPESLRHVLRRYYAKMEAILTAHGGSVEKFIGDAVMAVFGVPALHEDDALRASRAACEMRDSVVELNRELEEEWGAAIQVRIGVNTGEVVTTADRQGAEGFVVGDPVNTAARFEQAAEPGEVVIGDNTYRLIRDAARAERLEPLTLKGKAQPVVAWRLLDVDHRAPGLARRLDSPLVGRERELAMLEQAVSGAIAESAVHMISIIAPAGTGKSRLTQELVRIIGDRAEIVVGHCLPYGDGITFWPMREILHALAGIGLDEPATEARRKLELLVPESDEAPMIRERLAGILNLADPSPHPEETFWALRRLFETLARERPLAMIVDDIHWAEATLLDLIEYLVGWTRGVPLIIVCPTRPELLETRPTWTAARPEATSVVLPPLAEQESRVLLDNLLGGAIPPGLADRVVQATEGNPLFVEELVRILIDDGHLVQTDGVWHAAETAGEFTIPPSIEALLAARLDRLSIPERAVLERAAVIGREFWWSAVSAMSPLEERPAVSGMLHSLARREFIRPTISAFMGEDAFRFGHVLMRDATYRAMGKLARAGLHESFAEWLLRKVGDRAAEYEEILGFHLEAAHLLLKRLAPLDEQGRDLGRRAATYLSTAGRRAFARGDMSAAAALLRRAGEVLPKRDLGRVRLLPDLGEALLELGRFPDALGVLDEAVTLAQEEGDGALAEQAALVRLAVQLYAPADDTDWSHAVEAEVARAIPIFERADDEAGLALAWRLRYGLLGAACRFGEAADAAIQVIEHATRASEPRMASRGAAGYALSALYGPTPVAEAIERCEGLIEQVADDRRTAALITATLAQLQAMTGNIDRARTLQSEAQAILSELGGVLGAATSTDFARIELLAGNREGACDALQADYQALKSMGDQFLAASVGGMLAHVLYLLDDLGRAESVAREVQDLAGADDVDAQAAWRSVLGLVNARRGEAAEAVRLAEESVALRRETDSPTLLAAALADLGAVLDLIGREEGAGAAREEALRLYEAKGDTASAARLQLAAASV